MHPLLRSSQAGRRAAQLVTATGAAIAAAVLLSVPAYAGAPPATRAGLSLVALERTGPSRAASAADTTSRGLTPQQISTAYGLPTSTTHRTVAIVSAYDDPDLNGDLAAYDTRFHLPACTTANGCVRKLNQGGDSAPLPSDGPASDQWITESALGTEVVHGLCHSCRILLVEADTADEASFSQAAQTAAGAGAAAVVTTFTGVESPSDGMYAGDYVSPHATFVAAVGDPLSGDYGYTGDLNFPSVLPTVIAVGGTQLRYTPTGRYEGETAWKGTVTGCSLYESDPVWQTKIAAATDCGPKRVVADLSAVADPGAIVHIAGAGVSGGPWYVAGGTSVSAPLIGAVLGLAGTVGTAEAPMLYQREQTDPGAFHDILSGANVQICKALICRAGKGWDGPTGLGTPAGLEAFLPAGPKLSAAHPRISLTAPRGRLALRTHWTSSLQITNGNAFRISATIALRRTLRVAGRLRQITFATATFKRASLAGGSTALTIAPSHRPLLRREGSLTVYADIKARGDTGSTVTIQRKLTLVAPSPNLP